MRAAVTGSDLFQFFWVAMLALYLGGAARVAYAYWRRPPNVTEAKRRRLLFGDMIGGALLVVGFVWHVVPDPGEALAPATLVGVCGLLVILVVYLVSSGS